MSIYLKEPLNKSPETAKIIRDKLHATHVKDLVQSVSLVYDSADFTSESAEDARIVRLYEAFGVNTITPQEAPGCPTSVRPAEDDRKQRYDAGRLQIYRQGDQRHGCQRRC
jgi:hypothetical protein